MATIAHPHLESWEFVALQTDAGWTLPLEFLAGEAVVMPPIGERASSAQGELFHALRLWQKAVGDAGLVLQDVFVLFPGHQYVAPDIAWWHHVRRPPPRHGAVDVVPDLVIEVLSPKTRDNDLGVKRDLYLRSGVREVWLVDPAARTVTRATPGAPDAHHGVGDTLRSELMAGFELPVTDIFIT